MGTVPERLSRVRGLLGEIRAGRVAQPTKSNDFRTAGVRRCLRADALQQQVQAICTS